LRQNNATTFAFGGAGFLGKAFMRKMPDAVVCDSVKRLNRAQLNGIEFDFGTGQLAELPCGVGDNAVIFSWRGYPAAHEEDPVGKLSLNLSSTLELISFLAHRGVGHVLYASSGGTVYGQAGAEPVSESVALQPIGFYGIGKATAEMYVRKVCQTFGIRFTILRIANAYGLDQLRDKLSVGLVARTVIAAKTAKPLQIWGNGSNKRDYISADDVAAAFVSAITSDTMSSGVYNVGTGTTHSNSQIVTLVEEVLGRRVNIEWYPARHFDVGEVCLDCSALRSATRWAPQAKLEAMVCEMAHCCDV